MDFFEKRAAMAERNWNNSECRTAAKNWHDASRKYDYQYMFQWLGHPIIQDPQDICALQEIIWRIQPQVIVETGIARGGSLMLSAGILAAISHAESLNSEDSQAKNRFVVGVDIDIRAENLDKIENHALSPMIQMIQGSSIDSNIFAKVKDLVDDIDAVLVILDSNHTHDHVLEELKLYSQLVTKGSAIFVMDTGIENAPVSSFNVERPWGPGNSPLSAVNEFLGNDIGAEFSKDQSIEKRFLLTCATEGLLVKE
jgi:cephalosporin hydroxylase